MSTAAPFSAAKSRRSRPHNPRPRRMAALPRIPQSTIEEVSRRGDIHALLARFGRERESNRMYRCPMHDDGTASLKVYPADGGKAPRFQCFGCGAGGDAIELVRKLSSSSFPEAIRLVAEVSGVFGLEGLEPPQPAQQEAPVREPLGTDAVAIVAAAQGFFVGALGSDGAGAEEARRYLASRGIGPEVANLYGVGFAPPSWSVLTDELVRLGAEEDSVVEAGLARLRKTPRPTRSAERTRSSSGARRSYDLFRGRLTFPLASPGSGDGAAEDQAAADRVVGFGARLVPGLDAGSLADAPKYLNSPDSEHFSKGELLFGLPQAVAALEREDQVVALVEGYLDVLALAEAGVPAVAPCGTAFSAEQAARLRGAGAKRVLVLFDGDAAGQAATGPAVEKLLAAGLLPIVGVLGGAGESAVDPAEVLVQHGVEELRRRVEASPQPVVDYVITGAVDDGGDPEADVGAASGAPGFRPVRLGAADDVFAKALRAAERIALSPEPLVRGVLAREVGLALGMPFEAILAQVYRVRASAVERGPQEASQGGD